MKKKNRSGGLTLLILKVTINLQQAKQYGTGMRRDIQTNGIELKSLEINQYMYGQRNFNKGAISTQWGKKCFFNKWCWKNRFSNKRKRLNPCITPYTKINSKGLKT